MHRKEYDRDYYQKNRAERLKKAREYYEKNREKIKDWSRKYYYANRAKTRERDNARSRRNYLLDRDAKLQWQKDFHRERRIELLTEIGDCKCAWCGFSDWRALQIDHVNGDGHIERKQNGRKSLTRKQQRELIMANPERYQVLCCNCNWIKKYENGEHAQKRINIEAQTYSR